jgi:hypothetical protein
MKLPVMKFINPFTSSIFGPNTLLSTLTYLYSSQVGIIMPIAVAARSEAQTLGSWVRIPLETCMSVCVYSAFMFSCVQVVALRRADPPFKES